MKTLPAVQETRVHPWVGKTPWRRAQHPTPVFLPRKSRGQRSLAGCSPQGRRELDMPEMTKRQLRRDPRPQHLTANAGRDHLCAQGDSKENASWNSSCRHGRIQAARVPSLIPDGLLSFEINFITCENKDGHWTLWAYRGITAFSPGRESEKSLSPTQPSSPFFKPHGGLWLSHSCGQSLQTRVSLSVLSGHAWTISAHLLQSIRSTWGGEIQSPSENNEFLDIPKQTSRTQTLL